MGSPQADTVTVQIADRQMRLVVDINALCQFELAMQAHGFDALAEIDDLQAARPVKFVTMRAMIWAALQQHHPKETETSVGRLMHDHGPVLSEALEKAMQIARSDAGAGDDSVNGGEPQSDRKAEKKIRARSGAGPKRSP